MFFLFMQSCFSTVRFDVTCVALIIRLKRNCYKATTPSKYGLSFLGKIFVNSNLSVLLRLINVFMYIYQYLFLLLIFLKSVNKLSKYVSDICRIKVSLGILRNGALLLLLKCFEEVFIFHLIYYFRTMSSLKIFKYFLEYHGL